MPPTLLHPAIATTHHTLPTTPTLASFSHKLRNPWRVSNPRLHHPEVSIVQHADRLDAMGAVGVGRAITSGGASGVKGGWMDGWGGRRVLGGVVEGLS